MLTTRSAIPAASACMVSETFPSRSGIHWQYFTCTQLARVRSLFGTITSAQLHRCCFFCCALARMQTQRMPRQQCGALMMHARSTLSMPFEAWLGLTGRLAGQVVRWCCFAWVGGAAAYIGTITAALHIRLLCDPAMPGLVGAVAAAWSHRHDDDTAPRGRAVQAHFVRVACCICSTKLIYTGCSAARSSCYDASVLY